MSLSPPEQLNSFQCFPAHRINGARLWAQSTRLGAPPSQGIRQNLNSCPRSQRATCYWGLIYPITEPRSHLTTTFITKDPQPLSPPPPVLWGSLFRSVWGTDFFAGRRFNPSTWCMDLRWQSRNPPTYRSSDKAPCRALQKLAIIFVRAQQLSSHLQQSHTPAYMASQRPIHHQNLQAPSSQALNNTSNFLLLEVYRQNENLQGCNRKYNTNNHDFWKGMKPSCLTAGADL